MSKLRKVHLDDKYTLEEGQIFINGMQALVRLPMMQHRRDQVEGLNTAGFISGYRGSPLGGYDLALWKANGFLEQHNIVFQPGINEDLGATAVWGSQQVNLYKGAKVDGTFGIWYGKGPGVDRSGDVFKHANAAGTSKNGGVLLLMGDDHACKSSTMPHQSDYAMMDAFIPIISPAGVQEVLDAGIYGWALSRYTGLWCGFKLIADVIDTSASVNVDPDRIKIKLPTDFTMPAGGLSIRWPDRPHDQERRLHDYKLKAVPAFVRANNLNRAVWGATKPHVGVVCAGKSYLDVRQAFDDLGVSEEEAKKLGIAIFKPLVLWPLEPESITKFATGLKELIVVEEKRPLLEDQIKALLYPIPQAKRPVILGKTDESGAPLFPATNELNAFEISAVLGERLKKMKALGNTHTRKVNEIINRSKVVSDHKAALDRLPFYCSGCPHNTSTMQLPSGSRTLGGIGCHYMATWIDHNTSTFTQMGGEGVPWIGQAPFTEEEHIFANLGDGTYYHSGLLAIRAAVAAKVNITYKLLYNDAVAMTGGQPVDGPFSVAALTKQIASEGVKRIAVVSDDLNRTRGNDNGFAHSVTFHDRSHLQSVQEDLKLWPGTSVLIYDQTCAAEKRRRRKRGLMEDPAKRIFINEAVCEGCGDCGIKSNCLSVTPLETEWGRKRSIDQSSCNKDYSCVNGFCPSFVSVHGGELRKPDAAEIKNGMFDNLPAPASVKLDKPFNIYVTGVGGTGIITIGGLVGMAAHVEKKGVSVVDMAGLAQKGGAVVSHIRIANKPEDIHSSRIATHAADLVLGCDVVVSSGVEGIDKIQPGKTHAIINTYESVTGAFTRDPDYVFPMEKMKKDITAVVGKGKTDFINLTRISTALMGDSIMMNIFAVGYALQKGLIPLSPESVERAIELNNVAIEKNKRAFRWGRLAAADMKAVEKQIAQEMIKDPDHIPSKTLEEKIDRRRQFLVAYQNHAYARKYTDFLMKIIKAEEKIGKKGLVDAVAQSYFRLMAYKDEYEVGRLYTNGDFERRLKAQFSGKFKLKFHLAPPMIARRHATTNELVKEEFGPWVFKGFKLLAKMKNLRGTKWDVFGRTAERKMERQLIKDYEALIGRKILPNLNAKNYSKAVELARLAQDIRGYGHVKERNYNDVMAKQEKLLEGYLKG